LSLIMITDAASSRSTSRDSLVNPLLVDPSTPNV
jgi:hypothetical protein